jgi:3',5'-cyclic AMP phosphodiesterase CpdA
MEAGVSELTLLAQLTDTHVIDPATTEVLYADHNARLTAAVVSINAESPEVDAVIATGDLVQWGTPREYEELVELLAPLSAPVLPLPGNHDDGHLLRDYFPEHPWADADHSSWVAKVGKARIIGLDSTRAGESGAEIDAERLAWLDAALGADHSGPTLLAMHHPPFRSGIDWMDQAGFIGVDAFTEVISAHRIDRVLCGHLHRPMSAVVGGHLAEVGPSTAVHIELDLVAGAPRRVILDPIGYRLLAISSDDAEHVDWTVVGHTRYVDTGHLAFEPDWSD